MASAADATSKKKAARREEKQSLLPVDSADASSSPVRKHKSIIVNVCSFILVTEVRLFPFLCMYVYRMRCAWALRSKSIHPFD